MWTRKTRRGEERKTREAGTEPRLFKVREGVVEGRERVLLMANIANGSQRKDVTSEFVDQRCDKELLRDNPKLSVDLVCRMPAFSNSPVGTQDV